jgi:hypothetical protein
MNPLTLPIVNGSVPSRDRRIRATVRSPAADPKIAGVRSISVKALGTQVR